MKKQQRYHLAFHRAVYFPKRRHLQIKLYTLCTKYYDLTCTKLKLKWLLNVFET